MKGSIIAGEIIADWKREEYFKKKAIRQRCNNIECYECKYKEVCQNYIEKQNSLK